MKTKGTDSFKRQAQIGRNDVGFWNDFAPNFLKKPNRGGYEEKFFEYAEIKEGQTVFDMGCGAGTLSLPLAEKGHEVYAADFSDKMLELLSAEAEKRGVSDKIHTFKMSWDDDWEKFEIPVCDIAIASRSMLVEEPKDAIRKLSEKARERIFIVTSTQQSPRYNTAIADAIGREYPGTPDFIYVINVLFEMGIMPELRYIKSQRKETFKDAEECFEQIRKRSFPEGFNKEEEEKFRKYIELHLKQTEKDGETAYMIDEPWPVRWAFLSWDK